MSDHVNIEIKARTKNIETIKSYLLENSTENLGVDHQKDTYYETLIGRLKLREGNIENSLILYERPDTDGPKRSDVFLVKLNTNSGLNEILSKSNGIKVIVEKDRHIFFINNVKFHLDLVNSLGEFVEIEAIDSDGTIGVSKLQEQCDYYMQKFQITNQDLVNCSYSDLILEQGLSVRETLEVQFKAFINKLKSFQEFNQAIEEKLFMDHACLRVEDDIQYNHWKENLSKIATLLIESEVNGREISTYKLYNPLSFDNITIDVIELPMAKPNSHYRFGFEHVEFVINQTFKNYIETHKNYTFDKKGLEKDFNPELRVSLDDTCSFKLHHLSLEEVIKIESK